MEKITTLISAEQIAEKVSELAAKINADFGSDKDLYVVSLLNGAVFFAADLTRKLTMPVVLGFMDVSSYEGTESVGTVRIDMDVKFPVKGKRVLLVEDIVDTGRTLSKVVAHIKDMEPADLRVCTLLDKPERRVISDFAVDYSCFIIPNKFVVGYGLDIDQKYRNLPYIGVYNQ